MKTLRDEFGELKFISILQIGFIDFNGASPLKFDVWAHTQTFFY